MQEAEAGDLLLSFRLASTFLPKPTKGRHGRNVVTALLRQKKKKKKGAKS